VTAPRIFISHSAHERKTELFLHAIEKVLSARGFMPFVDRTRLRPGAEWRNELYTEIFRSHGAIILFSESTVKSDWVLFEATALAQRRWAHPDEFVLVPVILEPLTAAILNHPRFAPLDLARLHVGSSTHERNIVSISQAFDKLLLSCSDSPLDLLEEVVVDAMPRRQAALERAAQKLNIVVTDALDGRRTVAHAFFHATIQAFYEAMKHLAPAMNKESAAKVVDIVLPFWVRANAVVLLVQAALNPPPRAISLLNAEDKLIAEMYVRRAAAHYPLQWTVVPVTAAGGERTVDAVIGEIREHFRRQIDNHEKSDEQIDRYIAHRTRIVPVVVIFPPATRAKTIMEVRAKYPECTYLVRTGRNEPQREQVLGLNARVLTPPLQPGDEDVAADFHGVLRQMLENMV
jgi:hypothetical protein